MLYFIYGDKIESRKSLVGHLNSLVKKRPDAEVFRIKEDNYSKDLILELLSSQGLFSKKYIIVMDSLLENDLFENEILELFNDFKSSEHIFLCIEHKINKKIKEQVDKFSEKVWEFKEAVKERPFDVFSLANYLGNKDKKNLWISFLKADELNISSEEILGVLFWQIKAIVLAKKTKNVALSGLSPYVYKNALNFSKKWGDSELIKKADELVSIGEFVRDGEGETSIYLEKFILGI